MSQQQITLFMQQNNTEFCMKNGKIIALKYNVETEPCRKLQSERGKESERNYFKQ